MSPTVHRWLVLAAGVMGLVGVALGEATGRPMLGWLGWMVPALGAWGMDPVRLRPRLGEVGWGLLGWVAALAVVVGVVGVACLVGEATWDPAGEGLRAAWLSNEAGEAALRRSALHTLALGQVGFVLGAPLYALPQGAALALWAEGLPRWSGRVALAVWVGLAAGLGGLGEPGVLSALAGTGLAMVAVGVAAERPLGRALAVAGLLGLPAAGPLLAAGGVGWRSVATGIVALVLGGGLLVGQAWTSRRQRHRAASPAMGATGGDGERVGERGAAERDGR